MKSNSLASDDQDKVIHRSRLEAQDTLPLSTRILFALDELPEYDAKEAENTLFDKIDPDALDALFKSDTESSGTGKLIFTVDDYEITVTETGDIFVREL